MAIYRRKVAKKKVRMRKKVAKKKVSRVKFTNEQVIDRYAKSIESDLAKGGYDNVFEMYRIEFDKAKRFDIGDIVNIAEFQRWNSEEEEKYSFRYYKDECGRELDIKVKYKVTHKDSQGYCHVQKIEGNGSLSRSPMRLDYDLKDMFADGDDIQDYDFAKTVVVDPDFIDATLLGADYEPLAEYNAKKKEREDEDRAKVEAYYKTLAENKKAHIPTKYVKERNQFYKNLNIGDTIYIGDYDKPFVLKIKQDKLMVFKINKTVYTYTLLDFKSYDVYTIKPTIPKRINNDLLIKYKPEF